MRRRDALKLIASAAAAPPFGTSARAQPRGSQIGFILGRTLGDPEAQRQAQAFDQEFRRLGWSGDRAVDITYRSAAGDAEQLAAMAQELVAMRPAVIVAHTTRATAAILRETRTTPVVFIAVTDPIASGFVASLQRPGGNATGFVDLEPSLGGKLVELLKQLVPGLARVACLFNPETAPGGGAFYLDPLQAAAAAMGVTVVAARVRDAAEIERAIETTGREPNSGLVVMPDVFNGSHQTLIIASAARHRVPAVYAYRLFPANGGLASYGIDLTDLFRRAASYVDRVLRGAQPAELPVQLPTRFELIINLATARALGLDVPPGLLVRADEVIE